MSDDLVQFIVKNGSAERLLREHAPDEKGRCPKCRSLGCTTYAAAQAAAKLGGSHRG